jgi:hypothetical protein
MLRKSFLVLLLSFLVSSPSLVLAGDISVADQNLSFEEVFRGLKSANVKELDALVSQIQVQRDFWLQGLRGYHPCFPRQGMAYECLIKPSGEIIAAKLCPSVLLVEGVENDDLQIVGRVKMLPSGERRYDFTPIPFADGWGNF